MGQFRGNQVRAVATAAGWPCGYSSNDNRIDGFLCHTAGRGVDEARNEARDHLLAVTARPPGDPAPTRDVTTDCKDDGGDPRRLLASGVRPMDDRFAR